MTTARMPMPMPMRLIFASSQGKVLNRNIVGASCDCIMGDQSFVRTAKTQAGNQSGGGKNAECACVNRAHSLSMTSPPLRFMNNKSTQPLVFILIAGFALARLAGYGQEVKPMSVTNPPAAKPAAAAVLPGKGLAQ